MHAGAQGNRTRGRMSKQNGNRVEGGKDERMSIWTEQWEDRRSERVLVPREEAKHTAQGERTGQTDEGDASAGPGGSGAMEQSSPTTSRSGTERTRRGRQMRNIQRTRNDTDGEV